VDIGNRSKGRYPVQGRAAQGAMCPDAIPYYTTIVGRAERGRARKQWTSRYDRR